MHLNSNQKFHNGIWNAAPILFFFLLFLWFYLSIYFLTQPNLTTTDEIATKIETQIQKQHPHPRGVTCEIPTRFEQFESKLEILRQIAALEDKYNQVYLQEGKYFTFSNQLQKIAQQIDILESKPLPNPNQQQQ